MNYPRMVRIRQRFSTPALADVEAAVRAELAGAGLAARIRPGDTVAIPVGSRGIAGMHRIVRALVGGLTALDARPFIVPAMGSHGGATAEGQRRVIEHLGVTEDSVGAPIRSGMEVEQVGSTPEGIPVYLDRHAAGADHLLVVNRIKPHTDFFGEIESGLHKMLLIGLGKWEGARVYHQAILHHGFDRIVRSVSREVIRKCRVVLGLAIMENERHETALVRAVQPHEFYEREKELLALSRRWMARIPFPEVDLLIVDRIGKEISGTGMDTNVIGRKLYGQPATCIRAAGAGGLQEELPRVTRIFVRDLSDETEGNATGIGLAEYTTRRLVERMDAAATYTNCITSNRPQAASIPIPFDSDRQAVEAALGTIGLARPEGARVLRIRDTLHLEEMLASEAYLPDIEGRDDLSLVEGPMEMGFAEDGGLADL